MTQWEYLEQLNCATCELNELGKLGWELVTVVIDSRFDCHHIFKRPMPVILIETGSML